MMIKCRSTGMKAAVNRPWCWLIREIKHVLDTRASNSVHTGVQWSSHPLVIAGIRVQRKRDSCSTPTSSRCACAVVGFRIIPQETILNTIDNLKRPAFFSNQDAAIHFLEDYSVHVSPETQKALRKRGYIPIVYGGGINWDVQENDTHVHHRLKAAYRQLLFEMKWWTCVSKPVRVSQLMWAWFEAKFPDK